MSGEREAPAAAEAVGGVAAAAAADLVLAALAEIPDTRDVVSYRAHMATVDRSPLGRALRQGERMAGYREIPAQAMAEVWCWSAYLQHVRGYRDRTTCATYVRALLLLLSWATREGLDHAELSPQQLDGWQKHLALTMHHSAHFRGRQVYAVRSFYEWRESRGLGRNVAGHLRGPREPIRMPRKYSVKDMQAMCRAAASVGDTRQQLRDVALLLFLLATGARREEITNITLGALHIGNRVGLVRFHGKGAKEREVSFEGPVVDAMAAWLVEREQVDLQDVDAVFVSLATNPGQTGRKLSVQAVDRIITRHARRAGLKEHGVHRFRVTFATTLYDDGVGIEEIRILMGHTKIETTRRYLSVSERMRRTRMRADRQHEVLGTRNTAQPRWLQQAIGKGVP